MSAHDQAETQSGEQVVDGEIAVRTPRLRPAAHGILREQSPPAVVPLACAPHAEIAGRTHRAPAETPREIPLRGPQTESAERGDGLDDARVRRVGQRREV